MTDFPAPPPPPEYATNIPARGGQSFKFHKHLGHAKNAVTSYHGFTRGYRQGYAEAWVLKWNGQSWDTVFYIPEGTRHAELPWSTN